jgi:hypothetical protein
MKNFKKIAVVILVLLLLFSLATLVMARAGGGHGSRSSSHSSSGHSSYSGGSNYSSSGHSYSSGSGGGGLGGIFVVIIFIGVFVFIAYMANKGKTRSVAGGGDEDASGEEDEPNLEPAPDLETKFQQLKAKDPGFNEQVFQDKVSLAFFKIQHAWCERNMNPARSFISDAVYNRFNLQLEEYVSKNQFNKLDELSLDKAEIMDLRSDANYDTIEVWITATARDYIVDDKGTMVSDSKELSTWDEKWSFVRSIKVQTLAKEGVQNYKCPNCGSPAQFNAVGECEYCHSNLTKYDFDWVLSEITQLNQ